jgi:hypothetical protein
VNKTNRKNGLNLDEARQRNPPVSAVEAMRNSLQLALFGAVTENDVAGMATKLKEMASRGDLRAMKLFFDLVTKSDHAPPPQPQQIAVVIQMPVAASSANGNGHTEALPAPVVTTMPLEEAQRRQAMSLIAVHGPKHTSPIAKELKLPPVEVIDLLAHEWFDFENDGYHLSAAGRAEINRKREY